MCVSPVVYIFGLLRWHGGKEPDSTQETQEMWFQSLGLEDPLEKELSTDSGILSWKTPRAEEPGGLQSIGDAKNWTQLSD